MLRRACLRTIHSTSSASGPRAAPRPPGASCGAGGARWRRHICRMERNVARRKARRRGAAARASGLKPGTFASTRSKHVHGALTSAAVSAATAELVAVVNGRIENSHACQRAGSSDMRRPMAVDG
eukprot:2877771-Prymnesium_polylepis.1